MTDFVVAAVQDPAQRAINQAEILRLTLKDQESFEQALLSPPKPAPALKRAFSRRKKLLRWMSAQPFRLVPLDAVHDRKRFDSRSTPLDRYLREQVAPDIRRRVAFCFVAVTDEQRIAGCYTLASASVALSDLPEATAKKLPRYPSVPAVRHANAIIVMDQGRIVEGGSHDQLVKQCGIYAKLWAMQA